MTTPVFAIVGHPNKGKSSIVSTLSRDDSVAVAPIPGTTVKNRAYPMRIDDQVLYTLVDTPGFQRARAALEWMRQHSRSSVDRPEVVRRFVEEHRHDERYFSECELLTPVLEGAGILYVVDGSKPFGEEYEAEMEILRWTGQPSLALINMIGDTDHSAQWQKALGQHFRIVRVFDALTADFDKRVQLLLAFGEINEAWRPALEHAVEVLRSEQDQRRATAARMIAENLVAMLTYTVEQRLSSSPTGDLQKQRLRERYRKELTARERGCRQEVEALYHYHHLERQEAAFELLEQDLFAEETWRLFGLTRRQLVATGGVGGASAGAAIDLAVGGHSLFLGAGLGALIGGVSTWLTADRVAEIKVMGLPLGGELLVVGPMRNVNFPYVVLSRALLHHQTVEQRTHADRGPLRLGEESGVLQRSDAQSRKRLEKIFSRLRKQEQLAPEMLDELGTEIEALMKAPPTTAG